MLENYRTTTPGETLMPQAVDETTELDDQFVRGIAYDFDATEAGAILKKKIASDLEGFGDIENCLARILFIPDNPHDTDCLFVSLRHPRVRTMIQVSVQGAEDTFDQLVYRDASGSIFDPRSGAGAAITTEDQEVLDNVFARIVNHPAWTMSLIENEPVDGVRRWGRSGRAQEVNKHVSAWNQNPAATLSTLFASDAEEAAFLDALLTRCDAVGIDYRGDFAVGPAPVRNSNTLADLTRLELDRETQEFRRSDIPLICSTVTFSGCPSGWNVTTKIHFDGYRFWCQDLNKREIWPVG